MKLYLSSYRVPTPHRLLDLLKKPFSEVTMALIPHAQDYYSKRARQVKLDDAVKYFEELGVAKVEVVDLLAARSPTELRTQLEEYDLVWAIGSNTFTLREAMRHSGFDDIIRPILEKGVVYGGDSAGALVAGASIAGAEVADDPAFAEEVIKDGLDLVPFVVAPHAGNPKFYDLADAFRDIHGATPVKEITDAQALVVEDDSVRIMEPAPPSIRSYVSLHGEQIVTDILRRFLASQRPSPTYLLWFERPTPDSFMWCFSIGGVRYFLYAEDYVPSLAHVKEVFAEYARGDWELMASPEVQLFEDSDPVRRANVYERPADADEIMKHAIGSGPDFVFLARSTRG